MRVLDVLQEIYNWSLGLDIGHNELKCHINISNDQYNM